MLRRGLGLYNILSNLTSHELCHIAQVANGRMLAGCYIGHVMLQHPFVLNS